MTWGEHRRTIVSGPGAGLPMSIINNALNLGLEMVQARFVWPRADKEFTVPIAAPYIEGTVDMTAGDVAVTGTGTSWTDSMDGWRFRAAADNHFYTVQVLSGTTLELDRPYEGTTAADVAYRLAPWRVEALDLTMNIKSVVSSLSGELLLSHPEAIDALDPHRLTRRTYPERYYLLGDTSDRAPQNVEVQQIAFWPEVETAQSLIITAPERIIPCSDETLALSPPAWVHSGALTWAAMLALADLAPDGAKRVNIDSVSVKFQLAMDGMTGEVNRQPISRQIRSSPQSENPCRNIR